MAVSYGPWQNNARIEWDYSVGVPSQSSTHVTVTVYAYLRMDQWSSVAANGTKSWSGLWGSGSGGQNFTLGPNQRVLIVSWSGSVALTDAVQATSVVVTANHFHGSTSSTQPLWIPARYARTPTGLTVTRVSDSQHTLNWSRNSTYTSVVVQRRTDNGGWLEVGRPTGNAFTWTDTTTLPGHRYVYRVAGIGGSGQSAWSSEVTVYTTPDAPTGVSAVRSGDDILVSADVVPEWATAFDVFDNDVLAATGVSLPWLDVAPNPAVPHTYKVRGTVDGLEGVLSGPSNTVQLLAAPNAPTNLNPNGGVAASDGDVRLAWTHNPVDTSAQTVYELRHRLVGGAWTTVSGTVDGFRDVSLALGVFEWQVRTKGDHPDWSPWSVVATVEVITRPGVAVTQPSGSWGHPVLEVMWSWFQLEGRPQSAWQVELLDADSNRVEFREGSGATSSFSFAARVQHGLSYTVRARAATGAVWSGWAVESFAVEFVAPADVVTSTVWDEVSGSMGVAVSEGRGPVVPDVTNLFTNPRLVGDGTWAEVRRNLIRNPAAVSSGASWGGRGGGTVPTVHADGVYTFEALSDPNVPATSFVRQTGTATTTFPQYAEATANHGGSAVTAGGTYTVSAWVRSSVAISLQFRFRQSGVPEVLTPGFAALTPNVWTRLEASVVMSSTASNVTFTVIGVVGSGVALGNGGTLDVTAALLSPTPGPYFDGSTTPETAEGVDQPEDFRWRWLGAENASESVMEIERVAGLTAVNCVAGVSTWDGKPAVRLIPNSSNANSRARFDAPVAARPLGTAIGTVHFTDELSGVISPTRLGLRAATPAKDEIAPLTPGSYPLRNEFTGLVSDPRIELWHGAAVGNPDVYWTDVALVAGTYDGPAFAGGDRIKLGDSVLAASWDGAVDNSTSTASMVPVTDTITIERSVDGGVSWEPWIDGLSGAEMHNLTDRESLSYGTTLYRVTGWASSGAASVITHEAVSDSGALWLSGGPGFETAVRLPFNPKLAIDAGRARALKRYAGREMPVAYAGEAITRTIQVSGMTSDESEYEVTAGVDALDRITTLTDPTHMFRDPDGRRVYGVVSPVQMPRETVAEGGVKPWNAYWGYSFTLTDTGR